MRHPSEKRLELLESLVHLCDTHASRLHMACTHISPLHPFNAKKMLALTDEQIGFMELLISRFGKLQDTIGAKLFPVLLQFLEQKEENLSFLDVLHKLEKLKLLPNAKNWIDIRDLRNQLTHEYPDNPQLMADNLNHALKSSQNLLNYWQFLREETIKIKEVWLKELS